MFEKLKMGMVGGGQGAFIGAIHRSAALLDGEIELVCGAFSSTPEKAKVSGREIGIPDLRNYSDYQEMFAQERKRPKNERMDFVSIVTPNHMHFPIAKAALSAGFHVMCDKPVTLSLAEARSLQVQVEESNLLFGITFTYSGYPMVKQARHLVADGQLGKLRKVIVEYTQGWLAEPHSPQNKQANWRADPAISGKSGCMTDIGSHACHLAEYISGENIEALCAELNSFVEGRKLDDDGMALLRMSGGIKGLLHASQVAAGEENNLTIRIYGEKGGLHWQQQEPNSLVLKWLDQPMQTLRAGGNHSPLVMANTRTPMGHPEGYLEAFANIYRAYAKTLQNLKAGQAVDVSLADFPTITDGVRSMALIESLIASSESDQKWFSVKD